jgi:hypothetical protein
MLLFLRDFMQRNLVKAIYMSQVGKGKNDLCHISMNIIAVICDVQ